MAMRQTKRMFHLPHPQNVLFEWWSEVGFVGLALLLAFWVAVAWPWWKLFRGNAIPAPLGAAFFAALGGNFAGNLFGSDHGLPSTLLPLLFLGALAVPLSQRFLELPGYPVRRIEWKTGPWRWLFALAAFPALFFAVAGTREGLNRAWGGIELRKGWSIAGPGEWDRAIPHYEKAMRLDPGSVDPPYFLAVALSERGRPEGIKKALELYDRVAAREPDYMMLHLQRYKALDLIYREEEAARAFIRAVQLEPLLITESRVYQAARDRMSTGNFREARVAYEDLLKTYPGNPLLWMDLGNIRFRMEDTEGAIEALERAVALNPEYVDALRALGKVAASAGRIDVSQRSLGRLRKLFPGQPWVENYAREIGLFPGSDPGAGQ